MKFDDDFFQPREFYSKPLAYSLQIKSNQYHLYIRDFMRNCERREPQDTNDLYNQLRSYFNSAHSGYMPLSDRERFWIMRALARFPSEERIDILRQASELSPGRPSLEIIDAITLKARSSARQSDNADPNVIAIEEFHLEDRATRNLIHQAILHVKEIDETTTRENRQILARHFLVRDALEEKKALAESVMSSIKNTGSFVIGPITFHGALGVLPVVNITAPTP